MKVEGLCDDCGKRPAMHSTWRWWINPTDYWLSCCECYVRDGNPPADWHPACMATEKALKEETDTEK